MENKGSFIHNSMTLKQINKQIKWMHFWFVVWGEKFIAGITLGGKIQLAHENNEFKPGANAWQFFIYLRKKIDLRDIATKENPSSSVFP